MVNAFYVAVGERIAVLRMRSGMTVEEFAAAARMNVDYARRVERGLQNLSLLTLGRASLVLKVPVASFFKGVVVDESLLVPRPRVNARDAANRVPPTPKPPYRPALKPGPKPKSKEP